MKSALPPLVFALLLCGCRSNQADASSSPAQVLKLAAVGSFDRSADSRVRLPDGLRKVTTWKTTVPVPAREVRVTYDIDQRTVAWRLDVEGGGALKTVSGAKKLKTIGQAGDNTVYAVEGGPFDGALALSGQNDVAVLSRPYALRYEKALLQYAGE